MAQNIAINLMKASVPGLTGTNKVSAVAAVILSATLAAGVLLKAGPASAQVGPGRSSGAKPMKVLTPVQTLRAFFTALAAQNAEALRNLILPVPDSDSAFLLADNALTPEKAKELAEYFNATTMTPRKPGETFAYPNGTKITAPKSPKGVEEVYIQTEEFAYLIRLVKRSGRWRVDTKPFLEGRTGTKNGSGSPDG